jgi:exodeoxyribonuclease VII small subunit
VIAIITPTDIPPRSFEEALHALEECVKRLESPNLPLAEAFDTYEAGEKLAEECRIALNTFRQRFTPLN